MSLSQENILKICLCEYFFAMISKSVHSYVKGRKRQRYQAYRKSIFLNRAKNLNESIYYFCASFGSRFFLSKNHNFFRKVYQHLCSRPQIFINLIKIYTVAISPFQFSKKFFKDRIALSKKNLVHRMKVQCKLHPKQSKSYH